MSTYDVRRLLQPRWRRVFAAEQIPPQVYPDIIRNIVRDSEAVDMIIPGMRDVTSESLVRSKRDLQLAQLVRRSRLSY